MQKKPSTVFASCDTRYFLDYGDAFIASAHLNNVPCHINIINPTELVEETIQKYKPYADFSMSEVEDRVPQDVLRTMYSINRFQVAPMLLNYYEGALILDIDCVIRQKLEFPKEDVGLFLREPLPGTIGWEKQGTHVAAGIVWFSQNASSFAQRVKENIEKYPPQWFVDQVALWETYNELKDKYTFKTFDMFDMDWDFREFTPIWTGKGNRKFENNTYVREYMCYKNLMKEVIKKNESSNSSTKT